MLLAAAHLYAGGASSAAGDPAGALAHYEQALKFSRRSDNRTAETLTLAWMAARTPPEERERTYYHALTALHDRRDWLGIWIVVESLAAHWAQDDPTMAALLLGHLQAHGIGHAGQARRRARTHRILSALPPDDLAESYATGATISRQELVQHITKRLQKTREVTRDANSS